MLLYRERSFRDALMAAGLGAFLLAGLALAAPAWATPADFELAFEPSAGVVQALPPLPSPAVLSIQLVLDDDSAEGDFGLTGGTARQFLWLNRFANPGRFVLREIWVLFPARSDVPLGGAVQLVVFLDPDGDPTNGADLLATYDGVVQAKDGSTFSLYPLATPLAIEDPGDVLIGVVNRFFTTGVDPPPTQPAALDTTASQGRSYFALWAGDPPDPPSLASATTIDLFDGALAGNLMIRGFGAALPEPIPALSGAGAAVLGALLALFAVWRLRAGA